MGEGNKEGIWGRPGQGEGVSREQRKSEGGVDRVERTGAVAPSGDLIRVLGRGEGLPR